MTELNCDVSAEQARALHRVCRAMHDGNCPNCGCLRDSQEMRPDFSTGWMCPECEFKISEADAKYAMEAFRPYMAQCLQVFEAWRAKRKAANGIPHEPQDPPVFAAEWPAGLKTNTVYRILCDDKGHHGGTFLQVTITNDGDTHVAMQDWEDINEKGTQPSVFPCLRVRTIAGGGRNRRTRQALLWLAEAIRLDNEENGVKPD